MKPNRDIDRDKDTFIVMATDIDMDVGAGWTQTWGQIRKQIRTRTMTQTETQTLKGNQETLPSIKNSKLIPLAPYGLHSTQQGTISNSLIYL